MVWRVAGLTFVKLFSSVRFELFQQKKKNYASMLSISVDPLSLDFIMTPLEFSFLHWPPASLKILAFHLEFQLLLPTPLEFSIDILNRGGGGIGYEFFWKSPLYLFNL